MLDVTKNYLSTINGKKVKCSTCGVAELCLPQGLTKDELKNLDNVSKAKRRMEKGDTLYHAGEKHTKIYAVSSGSYKTLTLNKQGREQITGFYLPGELIGLDGLGEAAPHSTAIAIESSTVCEIPQAEFNRMCGTNQSINHSFMCAIRKEIVREQQHMLTLGQMCGDARLAGFIIDISQRFKERGFSATEFNLNIPRHDIANYLSLAAETLSRLLGKFQGSFCIG
jgi:CRP/FNR family transcriptional regulator